MALARAVRRRGRRPARGGPGLDAAAGVAHRRGDAARAAPERPGAGGRERRYGVPDHLHHRVPEGTPGQAVDDTEAREARRAKELAGQGHLLRLWQLAGPSRALGLWNAGNPAEMQAILKSLPLDPWIDRKSVV